MRLTWTTVGVGGALAAVLALLVFMIIRVFKKPKEALSGDARAKIKDMCKTITLKWGGGPDGSINRHVTTVATEFNVTKQAELDQLKNICRDSVPATDGGKGTTKLTSSHRQELKKACKDNYLDETEMLKQLTLFYGKYPGIDRDAVQKECTKRRDEAKAESSNRKNEGGFGAVKCKAQGNNKVPGEICPNKSLRQTRPCLSKNGRQCCEGDGSGCKWISDDDRSAAVLVDYNKGTIGGSEQWCGPGRDPNCLKDCKFVGYGTRRDNGKKECPSDFPIEVDPKQDGSGQSGWDCTVSQSCKNTFRKQVAATVPQPAGNTGGTAGQPAPAPTAVCTGPSDQCKCVKWAQLSGPRPGTFRRGDCTAWGPK